jgi:protein involved in ribonucleotide reduction
VIIGENAQKIGKKINPRTRFLSTGWSHNPNFGVIVSSYNNNNNNAYLPTAPQFSREMCSQLCTNKLEY